MYGFWPHTSALHRSPHYLPIATEGSLPHTITSIPKNISPKEPGESLNMHFLPQKEPWELWRLKCWPSRQVFNKSKQCSSCLALNIFFFFTSRESESHPQSSNLIISHSASFIRFWALPLTNLRHKRADPKSTSPAQWDPTCSRTQLQWKLANVFWNSNKVLLKSLSVAHRNS